MNLKDADSKEFPKSVNPNDGVLQEEVNILVKARITYKTDEGRAEAIGWLTSPKSKQHSNFTPGKHHTVSILSSAHVVVKD